MVYIEKLRKKKDGTMKSYACCLQKGGTGKTSISVILATELANKGYKTILIDCDPQGNSSSWLLHEFEHELADVLYKKCGLLDCIYESDIENLFVLPTFSIGGELRHYAKNENFPFRFKKDIIPILNQHFDFCIFDTSPSFDEFEKSVFIGCDEVVPILRLDEFSKDGLQIFIKNLSDMEEQYGIRPEFSRIVLNQQDKRLKNETAYLKAFEEMNKDNKFKLFVIPKDPAFSKAQTLHDVIQNREFAAKKETLEAITKLAEGLAE